MMEKTRVSIVSYLNSKPFLYGLSKSSIAGQIDLSLEIPSKIVSKLSYNLTDIGLIPVAGLEDLDEYKIVSDYCIGAVGKVQTVILASEVPLDKIETILMDYQSRSSIVLAKVLAKFYWKKEFNWENTCSNFENKSIKGTTAGVVIGDRVFAMGNKFRYTYDLSEEWFNFTRLPFVFAVWAANKDISNEFEANFNRALSLGIENISEIAGMEQSNFTNVNIYDYFAQNISFNFDEQKKEGMRKFLKFANKLEPVELI